eukprot:1974577-Pyramimonas_sp.AAC.1
MVGPAGKLSPMSRATCSSRKVCAAGRVVGWAREASYFGGCPCVLAASPGDCVALVCRSRLL